MPLFSRRAATPAVADAPLAEDAERREVRSQRELEKAVDAGQVPVLVAAEDFFVGDGVLVEARRVARLHAVGSARVRAFAFSFVTAADDVHVRARESARVRLYGRANADGYDDCDVRAGLHTPRPFPDGSTHRTSDAAIRLHDRAFGDSSAPGTVDLAGTASFVARGGPGEAPTVRLTDRAQVQTSGASDVEVAGRGYVLAFSGRIRARDAAVVNADRLVDEDRPAPVVEAAGDVAVVAAPGVAVSGGRLVVGPDEALRPEVWLAVWRPEVRDGAVVLHVGVDAETGVVADPRWTGAALRTGDVAPEGLPLTPIPRWHEGRRAGVRLLEVLVPRGSLRPGRAQMDLATARVAGPGAVVGGEVYRTPPSPV